MLRTRLVTALAAATLALAACSDAGEPADGAGATAEATAEATAAATPDPEPTIEEATPEAEPSASPEATEGPAPVETEQPSPSAGTDVSSPGGLMSARVPAEWTDCGDAAQRASRIAVEVLGAWAVDGDCGGAVVLIEANPVPDGGLTAERYLALVLEPRAEESGATVESQLLTTADGRDGLVAVTRGGDGDSATLVVSAADLLVLGGLAGGPVDDAAVADLVDVGRSLTVGTGGAGAAEPPADGDESGAVG